MKTYAIILYSYVHKWQNTMRTMQLLVSTLNENKLTTLLYGRLPPQTKIYIHLICDLELLNFST